MEFFRHKNSIPFLLLDPGNLGKLPECFFQLFISGYRIGHGAVQVRAVGVHIEITGSGQSEKAVSYTHLDVYKRQLPSCT